jgi:membrane fusion protein, multidrug efflux system
MMTDVQKPSLRLSRTRVVLIGAAAALAAAWYGWRWFSPSESAAADAPKASRAIPVETAVVQRADIPVYLEGLGTVQAFNTVKITARVDGQIQKIAFVEGQTVKKGDLLVQIDPRPYRAALEQALAARDKDTAQLANAKRDLERYQMLAPQELVSRQTLDAQRALVDQIDAQLKSDQATIDNARTQLAYTTITAPIRARTGIRLVDPGNIVRAADSTGIVMLTQMQPISVIFTLPEDDLSAVNAALKQGSVPVVALSRDGKTELDRGTIALVDNQIDPTTGTIRLKATFANRSRNLWPGQFVNVRTLLKTEHNVLTIPSVAVQRGRTGVFAYVIRADSTVEARPITIGREHGTAVVVDSGLKDDARVVTSNQYRLQPNAHVRVVAAAAQVQAPPAPDGAR